MAAKHNVKVSTPIQINGPVTVGYRGVTVTPLASSSQSQPIQTSTAIVIPKVLLKAMSKERKGENKMFTIRNINTTQVSCVSRLAELIKTQLKGDIIAQDFDVGYVSGSNLISLRNKEDVSEIWAGANRGQNIVLWCDGLKPGGTTQTSAGVKRKASDSGTTQSKKDVAEQVQQCVENLKRQHDEKFTPMQYRVWSEMINGGIHKSTTDPPTTSMFKRCGSEMPSKKGSSTVVKDAMVEAVQQLASAITTPHQAVPTQVKEKSASPSRLIDGRSKCYKQLAELKNLKDSGIISDDEFLDERVAILQVLKKLGNS